MHAKTAIPLLMKSAGLAGLICLASLACGQAPQTVTSKDGTRIAYSKLGQGPAVILVGGALSDRAGAAELAQLLSAGLTVYSYDRRGRGDSGDTQPYAVRREVEDIEALIDQAGGSAYVYGKSSGAALALHAAAALGGKVRKLALYEAPYSEADGAAKEWKAFAARLDKQLAAKENAEAVTAFMKFVGAPDAAVAKLKASPAWPGMLKMAPTLAYDNALLGDDRSVPVAIAAQVKVPTLVLDGGASLGPMPFMRATADKLAQAIPGARRQVVEGQAHDVSAKALAPVLLGFFN